MAPPPMTSSRRSWPAGGGRAGCPAWPDDAAHPDQIQPDQIQPDTVQPSRIEHDLFEPDPFETGRFEPGLFDATPVRPPTRPFPLEDEHFVPPEPPPLPPIGPPVMVGLALVGAGLLLLVSPGWLGVSDTYGLPLGLVGIAAGLGWLVLRLWPDPPDAGERPRPDNGAVL